MQILRPLSYIGKRLLIIIPALLVAAILMLAMKRFEYAGTIEPGVSKLASVLYFHIASFGVLWLFLRAPFCWQRAVLVAVWIAYDVVVWTITGCYTGERFDWSYAATIWQETLMHRYVFFASAYALLVGLNSITKSRIIKQQDPTSVEQQLMSIDFRQMSLPRILRFTAFIAIGLTLVLQTQKLFQSRMPWLEFQFSDALQLSFGQFKSAIWSCLRGIVMWYIALFFLGKGGFNMRKVLAIASLLPCINLGLMMLQESIGMSDNAWEIVTPMSYATLVLDQFQWLHALIASMLTFLSMMVIRMLGYEFRPWIAATASSATTKIFDKIDA